MATAEVTHARSGATRRFRARRHPREAPVLIAPQNANVASQSASDAYSHGARRATACSLPVRANTIPRLDTAKVNVPWAYLRITGHVVRSGRTCRTAWMFPQSQRCRWTRKSCHVNGEVIWMYSQMNPQDIPRRSAECPKTRSSDAKTGKSQVTIASPDPRT